MRQTEPVGANRSRRNGNGAVCARNTVAIPAATNQNIAPGPRLPVWRRLAHLADRVNRLPVQPPIQRQAEPEATDEREADEPRPGPTARRGLREVPREQGQR